MSAIPGIAIGDSCYIGNQGSIRRATVIAKARSRVTIKWRNSVREMTRTVGVSYERRADDAGAVTHVAETHPLRLTPT